MGSQRFIAIDFETANDYLGSACSVGIAVVEDSQIVDSFYSLIRPQNNFFLEKNIEIHGITPDMTEDAPTLDELWPEIAQWFSPHTPVIAHNAHFDMSVLRLSTSSDIPDFPYVDSMQIAAPFIGNSCSLERCAEAMSISLGSHHNALDDACTAAEIVIKALQATDCECVWEMLAQYEIATVFRFADLEPQKSFGRRSRKRDMKAAKQYISHNHARPADIQCTAECIDQSNPLFGKSIVFTGELSMPRSAAMQIAVNAGAKVKTAVSKKTDYLVVGMQFTELVGEDGMSSKEEKAAEINRLGTGHIEVIDEATFLSLAKVEVHV